MDGDGHLIEITARRARGPWSRDSRLLGSIRPSTSHATQQWGVDGRGRRLPGRPAGADDPVPGQPLLPARSRRTRPAGRLIWGDVWLPGRYDRGVLSERFQFERIVQDLEVRREGRLIFRDRFRWDGPWTEDEVAMVLRRRAGDRQPVHRRADARARRLARRARRPDALDLPARRRGDLRAVVRAADSRHGRPRDARVSRRRILDRRPWRPALARRIRRPRTQPLVLADRS